GAERVEDREDVLVLDEVARGADGLRRDVLVVDVLVVDLALVHAAARVHVLEVGVGALGDRAEALRDSGQGRGPADVDRRRSDPRIGGRAAEGDGDSEYEEGRSCDEEEPGHWS